jgi:hypothetical protein
MPTPPEYAREFTTSERSQKVWHPFRLRVSGNAFRGYRWPLNPRLPSGIAPRCVKRSFIWFQCCFVENFSLTPGFSRVRRVREERKPFKRFSLARSWFTALKRGVNEMIFIEQLENSKKP